MGDKTRRQHIEDCVSDLVGDLLYYDRKEDEDLPRGAIEEAVANSEISIAEICALFEKELREHLREEVARG